jgi:CRISPR-associated exonuclease Cas4
MEDDAVEIWLSMLEHYAYCPRQCGLIHVEATYQENVYTIRGAQAHARVHSGVESSTAEVRARRNVPLWCDRLGLRGRADLIEFRPTGPYPVEYKVGKRRSRPAEVQLCAQAFCLEEMLGQPVPAGAIYYVGLRRRREVLLDEALRQATLETVQAVRRMLETQRLSGPVNDRRCRRCSLLNACLPHVVGDPDRLRGLQGALYTAYALRGEGQPDGQAVDPDGHPGDAEP